MSNRPETRTVGLAGIAVPPERMRALRPEVVDQLAESMRTQGLINPVTLTPRKGLGFLLLAGRHRYEAAEKLGWKSIESRIVTGLDADAAQLIEIDENLIRADLSTVEHDLHLVARKALYEKLHPETQHGGDRKSGRRKQSRSQNENLNDSFVKDTAKKTRKGRSTIAHRLTRAKKVIVLPQIANTSLDENDEVEALSQLPASEQQKLADRAKAGEKVSAKGAAKNYQRQERERALAAKTKAASNELGTMKRFPVIYIDLPWPWEAWNQETGMDRAPMYPTMSIEEIYALNIPAADDCALFLWATVPLLDRAIDVMPHLGFTYKSNIMWDKERIGTGIWARIQHEQLLIGTKGKIPAPAPGTQPPSVIRAKPGKHSEKPDIFAEIIEKMFPTLPKLEMFARKPRPSWTTWGNEL
jgi:N6-adenosine-specific RNA methylase IME4/ParB-like chromosome segregation protein Spo0J